MCVRVYVCLFVCVCLSLHKNLYMVLDYPKSGTAVKVLLEEAAHVWLLIVLHIVHDYSSKQKLFLLFTMKIALVRLNHCMVKLFCVCSHFFSLQQDVLTLEVCSVLCLFPLSRKHAASVSVAQFFCLFVCEVFIRLSLEVCMCTIFWLQLQCSGPCSQLTCGWRLCVGLPKWPSGSRVADMGFDPSLLWLSHTTGWKLALFRPSTQAPCMIGSVLGLVCLVSV